MSEKGQSSTSTIPGVAMNQFIAAVDSLVELCDSGKWMLFLPRSGGVRFIGDEQVFIELHQNRIEASPEQAREAIAEIRSLLPISLRSPHLLKEPDFLARVIYKLTQASPQLVEYTSQKEEVLQSKLIRPAMRSRLARMRSAVIPCLEELESEIVLRRVRPALDDAAATPFVRLRLRYSDVSEGSNLVRIFFGPDTPASENHKAFELEADESDIDLLILRLTEAKRSLGNADSSVPTSGMPNAEV